MGHDAHAHGDAQGHDDGHGHGGHGDPGNATRDASVKIAAAAALTVALVGGPWLAPKIRAALGGGGGGHAPAAAVEAPEKHGGH